MYSLKYTYLWYGHVLLVWKIRKRPPKLWQPFTSVLDLDRSRFILLHIIEIGRIIQILIFHPTH